MPNNFDKIALDSDVIIQQLSDGYVEIDLMGFILNYNSAAEQIFDGKTRVLRGKNFARLFEESSEKNYIKQFKKLLVDGNVDKFKATIIGENNSIKHVELSASITYYQDKPHRVFNIIRDVTENYNKQRETEILAERLLMSETAANLGCFEYVMGTEQKWWSKQMYEIYEIDAALGVPPDDFITEICHPDDKDMLWNQLEGVNKRYENYNIIHRVITKNGNLKWLSKKGNFKTSEVGNHVFFGTVQDVTNLYLEKEANKINQILIETVNNANQLLISEGDPKVVLQKCCTYLAKETKTTTVYIYKKISQLNDSDYDLVVHSELEKRGNKARNVVKQFFNQVGVNKWQEMMRKDVILDSNQLKFKEAERSFITKLGIKSILLIPIHLEDRYYGFMGFDNHQTNKIWSKTEKEILASFARKLGFFMQRADFLINLEENLISQQKQNLELLKINKEIDNFVYATFHDLRAPITNMQGLINLNQISNANPQELLNKMGGLVGKLYWIVNQIGDYAKNMRMPIRIQKGNADLILELVKNCINQCKFVNSTSISFNCNGNYYAITDFERLHIILLNLLQNAITFSQSALKPKVEINIDIRKDEIQFCVCNNGDFIKEENLERIFEMFTTASNHSQGGGMGLYITKETLNLLNGTIKVISQPELTTFTVILPNGSEN